MKLLTALLLAFLLFTSFLFSQNTFKLGFTGAYPNYFNYPVTSHVNWGWYNDMKLNTWSGWWVGDTNIHLLNSLKTNNISGLFQPDTLRWAAYGRQQVNEAESDAGIRFGYGSHFHSGTPVTDVWQGSTQRVQYYQAPSAPQTVLAGVKENGFQSFCSFPYDPVYQVDFPMNGPNGTTTRYLNTYYIKPRMRISIADTGGAETPVVKVIVKAFNGDTVRERIITNKNFRLNDGSYDGKYLEDYRNLTISVTGEEINHSRPNQNPLGGNLEACQVDYQVYWYGEVSVWIDYVKVMDEAANKLFTNQTLRDRLHDKITRLKNYEQANGEIIQGFYMEEVDYSNLACLKYLNEVLLPQWSGNNPRYKMIGLIAPWSFRTILKEKRSTDYADYFEAVDPPFLMNAQYPFASPDHLQIRKPVLPDNLSFDLNTTRYPQWVITGFNQYFGNGNPFGIIMPPSQYNTRTQDIWNAHIDSIKQMMALCRTYGKEYYLVPQVHYLMGRYQDFYYLVHKEPMNSEISAEFCLALCYGVHGIIPYAYESGFWNQNWASRTFNTAGLPVDIPAAYPGNIQPLADHTYGMTDFTESEQWGYKKRDVNFYGEPKWDYVQALYNKMYNWGPILANSNSTEGFSVHSSGAAHNCINNILSIDPHLIGPNYCMNDNGLAASHPDFVECPEQRFWEMGFFAGERYTRYFMLVNRRCVPAGGGYEGDDRVLKIKFEGDQLPGSWKNWQLSEVGGSTRPIPFSRNSGYLNLGNTAGSMGWFKPGEGKLFKITPTTQTGGDLVCDEVITGESFTCEDTIFSNGYNITIGTGTNMKFTDSSCIVMNGGVFTMGDQQVSGPQNITFDAASGNSWRGHSFTGTEVHIYGASFTGIANDSVYALNMVDCPVVDIRNTRVL